MSVIQCLIPFTVLLEQFEKKISRLVQEPTLSHHFNFCLSSGKKVIQHQLQPKDGIVYIITRFGRNDFFQNRNKGLTCQLFVEVSTVSR